MRDSIVSVIMPVYNAEKYLPEAIESILSQTFSNFEFIIIYDESTDNSLAIIKKYMLKDNRIILISRANIGLAASLNDGIEISSGKFIARMDADDISLHKRLENQVNFLESHDEIDIVGCDCKLMDKNSKIKRNFTTPKSQEDILMNLCYSVPFPHPSVMVRKKVFNKFRYQESAAEDYLLWTKCFNGHNFANLSEYLLVYREQYGGSLSDSRRKIIISEVKNMSKYFFQKFEKNINQCIESSKYSKYLFRGYAYLLITGRLKASQILKSKLILFGSIKWIFLIYARTLYWTLKSFTLK